MWRFALTIFLGAFLLFQVQPILGRFILPWFGGGANVWTVCMLFFQVALLAGYAYAHLLSKRLALRTQLIVHLALIVASLIFLPITPAADTWRSTGQIDQATSRILVLLTMHIGLPYLLLASTGPLLQSWFDREFPGRSPYRLYSLSNFASLLALLSYPFLIEPWQTLRTQGWAWTIGFLVYAISCAWCVFGVWRASKREAPSSQFAVRSSVSATSEPPTPNPKPRTPNSAPASPAAVASFSPAAQQALWIALAAVGSIMLIATTNRICTDLAVVPMLWVFPLAVYLITFIICFDADRWYHRAVFGTLLALSVLAVNYVMHFHLSTPMWAQIAAFGAALFSCCMICHGELVRLRPAPQRLTAFYLSISIGGALGGVIVALIAPIIFNDYWEYHAGLFTACVLAALCMYRAYRPRFTPATRRISRLAAVGAIVALAVSMGLQIAGQVVQDTVTIRNFYGVIHVREVENPFLGPMREMWHGQTVHGRQFLDPQRRRWATTYFGDDSGIGLAIEYAAYGKIPASPDAARRPVRVGVIGLGVGAIAAHTQAGDTIRFYEINPAVETVARRDFTYLQDTPANVEMVIGDARLMLEREAAAGDLQQFDVLAIDAFNSDSIPLHLITHEALKVYRRHTPNGLLVFNISNRYVNMTPVLRGLAELEKLHMVTIESPRNVERLGTERAVFIILTSSEAFVNDPAIQLAADPPAPPDARALYWTDDFASLWSVMTSRGIADIGKWNVAPMQGQMVIDRADLLERHDERRIVHAGRRLIIDTGGYPLAVVTVKGKTEAAADGWPIDFDKLARDMFVDLGLAGFGDETGMMILISIDDQQARIELGKAWDHAARLECQRIMREIVIPGLTSGNASAAIVAGAQALEAMARRRSNETKASSW